MTNNRPIEEVWADTLAALQPQMTRDTYDQIIAGSKLASLGNGTFQILAKSELAKDWQENRLAGVINRTLAGVVGHPVEVAFGVVENGTGPALPPAGDSPVGENPPPAPDPHAGTGSPADVPAQFRQEILTPAQKVAGADHYAAFFADKGTGYTQFSNYAIRFYIPLLKDKGFGLLAFLVSNDQRPIKTAPGWTEPATYNLDGLTKELGKGHHRYIGGEEKECEVSRLKRAGGTPLLSEADCCRSPSYSRLRFREHKDGGLMCKYWFLGALQLLDTHGLIAAEFEKPTAYNFQVQVWRRLHLLTPAQHEQLPTKELRKAHEDWLKKNILKHFGITYEEWLLITEPVIYPLMAGYSEDRRLRHNLAERQVWQEFIRNSGPNPNYGQPRRRKK